MPMVIQWSCSVQVDQSILLRNATGLPGVGSDGGGPGIGEFPIEVDEMVLAFGDFILDTDAAELRLRNAPVEIQPKAIALLQYLIERRHRVVSKQELLDALWPDQVVSEGVLKRAIHALRVAVADTGSQQSVIATRSRVGYRFVAELHPRLPPRMELAGAEGEPVSDRADFVGRALSLGRLRSAWARARSGHGAVVLIAGPPGIGKTRLVDEFSLRVVRREGGQILTGWCDGSRGAPPYWPWLQIVRGLDGDTADRLGTVDADRRFEASSVENLERADRSIFARQHAISQSLIGLARRQPLLVILEDLHWADRATLSALAFVAREITNAPILLVGTFRDDELPADHPLVGDLRRLTPRFSDLRLHLQGLSLGEVRTLLTGLAHHEPSRAAVDAIHAQTAGNPLFVQEVARVRLEAGSIDEGLESSDWIEKIPLGVIGILEHRLRQLPPDSRAVLETAAVIGAVFDRSLLLSIAGRDLGFIADALDAAGTLGIVRASRGDPADWEFTHALLRDALLHTMRPSRRLQLHRDLLVELEARHLPDPQSALARLADHANEIHRAGGDAHKALAYDRLAAWHAAARFAYHDCGRHAERALTTLCSLEARGYVDEGLAIELRIDRARAANMQREPQLALEHAEEAARLACVKRDDSALARAAMAVFIHPPAEADLVRRNVRLLELAEDHVRKGSPIWVRLVSARVMQLAEVPGSSERRARDSAEALERARLLGDPEALVGALSADLTSNWSRHPPGIRLAYSRELHRGVAGMPDRFVDVVTLLTALVEQGDLDAWVALICRMRGRIAAA
ncbi:MAG TPA: hypothetical protein ENI85_00750, partial [Deltaproteobacteria bacterium]|nr:hypothetical protein [Deltaproteobacteria bacterium]